MPPRRKINYSQIEVFMAKLRFQTVLSILCRVLTVPLERMRSVLEEELALVDVHINEANLEVPPLYLTIRKVYIESFLAFLNGSAGHQAGLNYIADHRDQLALEVYLMTSSSD